MKQIELLEMRKKTEIVHLMVFVVYYTLQKN